MARGRFNFYLNFQKDDELLVAERIDDLKRRRSFTSVVREGIIIISELREGRVDTLLRLYPWIVDVIRTPEPTPTDDGDTKRQLAELKRLIIEQGRAIPDTRESGFPAMSPALKQSGSGIGTLGAGVSFALPEFDDDELPQMTVKLAPLTGATNGSNLLSGMFGLEN